MTAPHHVIVPREPTEAMIDAAMPKAFIGHLEASEESKTRWFASHRRALVENYKAMLAAAPPDVPEHWQDKAQQIITGVNANNELERGRQAVMLLKMLLA